MNNECRFPWGVNFKSEQQRLKHLNNVQVFFLETIRPRNLCKQGQILKAECKQRVFKRNRRWRRDEEGEGHIQYCFLFGGC